jgi:hypothetical protein
LDVNACRILMNARTTKMLIWIALRLLKIFAAITDPCSVNAYGSARGSRCFCKPVTICDRFTSPFEVATCDLRDVHSGFISRKRKSGGKRCTLRFTAWFNTFVDTPYSLARSASRMIFSPRIVKMIESI